ncbi:MAG: pilus assembly protein [Novosphingobium sp.]|nr:pilus assembly protein [Novosphingobium sp.]
MSRAFRRLAADRQGSAIVEFGILAPAILTLFIGILQVGMWMQSFNALRSVAADTGRYVAVEYQKSNQIDNVAMALWARQHAIDNYLFQSANMSTDVTDAADQDIAGVTEKTLTLNYTMPSIFGIAGIGEIPVTFRRPIFVKAS